VAETLADPEVTARIDLHCHTNGSFDSIADPLAVVRRAAERGLTHLAITDHDTIEIALRARDVAPPGLTVIVGSEVSTRDGDLIFVFLQRALPRGLSAIEAIEAGREQGALVGIPHPFDRTRRSLLAHGLLPDVVTQVDWIEVWNARVADTRANEQATALAERIGRPGVAVSDSHAIVEIGTAWTAGSGDPGTAAGLRVCLGSNLRLHRGPVRDGGIRRGLGRWMQARSPD